MISTRFSTYKKKQSSDLRKFLNRYLKISYLDTKDNLPKKVGIVGEKNDETYRAAIGLIFKLITYRKKIRDKVISAVTDNLTDFETGILNCEPSFESEFKKFFIIQYFRNENKLADAINAGVIDYCVIPSKIHHKKSDIVEELEISQRFIGSNDIILSAASTIEYHHVHICSETNDNIQNYYCSPLITRLLDIEFTSNKNIISTSTSAALELSVKDLDSGFVCSIDHFKSIKSEYKCHSLEKIRDKSVEFRLLKYKTYKEKDDNAYPPSLHRRFKQLMYFLWRKDTLKSAVTFIVALLLYLYSLTFTQNEELVIFKTFTVSVGAVVSTVFSLVIIGVFKLLHISTIRHMRLKKIKGFWLLYTSPNNMPDEVKEHDPHLYAYPRVVRIDFSGRNHLEFVIHMLNNEGLYLKSESFFLDAHQPKRAKVVITYSNNQIPESKKRHGFLNGISELDCEIVYDSSKLYEMTGNFFSKSRLENGKLNYFRLADEYDFDLLRGSSFIPY